MGGRLLRYLCTRYSSVYRFIGTSPDRVIDAPQTTTRAATVSWWKQQEIFIMNKLSVNFYCWISIKPLDGWSKPQEPPDLYISCDLINVWCNFFAASPFLNSIFKFSNSNIFADFKSAISLEIVYINYFAKSVWFYGICFSTLSKMYWRYSIFEEKNVA